MKSGKNTQNIQRYQCKNNACPTVTFMLNYRYNACAPGIKEKVVDMAINSSGIRDTARVLKIDKNTVISILKSKEDSLVQVNPIFLSENTETPLDVRLDLVCEEAEIDEQWSFVEKKSNQRWLWHAVDHATNIVIAYVFGKRKDNVFKELKGFCRKGRLIVVLCRIYG
jgi:hypothetical protein